MSIYDIEVRGMDGELSTLKDYEGKVLLIVNTATKCGFTKQYDDIQKLYDKYADKGLVVLDFPCNQFMEQAPESVQEIHTICTMKFGVKFPIFAKVDVNGENECELFKYLKEQAPYVKPKGFKNKLTMNMLAKLSKTSKSKGDIRWNFTKFLVDKDGKVVARFEPIEDMEKVEQKINELL